MIVTSFFGHASAGETSDLDWEQEIWDIAAFLVPLDTSLNGPGAAKSVARSISAHDLDFQPWWRGTNDFDFGDARYAAESVVWPWIHCRSHRRTGKLLIEPRSDFLRYHSLDERALPDYESGTEYVHPLEGSVALRTWVERIAFYDPMPFVTVQPDYLRDYLAARNAALVIATVADRFSHAPTVRELELDPLDEEPIGENAWITTTIHEQSPYDAEFAMGRSSLYSNVLVAGYPEPKQSRSPWNLHDERREGRAGEQTPPMFIVDAEGTRRAANDRTCRWYLYFSLRVLDRYLSTPDHEAAFHMRTWGGATSPHGGVDVGVNSRELLTAFMPDIAKLPVQEQMHWASYSVLPDGEICWAMFETRMQQNPPDLPGVVDVITRAFNAFVDASESRFGVQPGDTIDGLPPKYGRLSIGPIHRELSEVAELAVPLYSWVVERLSVVRLRTILTTHSVAFEPSVRQLGLLRLVLTKSLGVSESNAKSILGPLDALNELRAKAAHMADADYAALLPRFGLSSMPLTPRRYWDAVVDAVAASLGALAETIRGSSQPPAATP